MDELSLLRQYEPIIRFTHGEAFYPCAVDEYLKRCTLWVRNDDGQEAQIAVAGDLDIERLATLETLPPPHTYYLRFVQEPLSPNQFRRWRQDPQRATFQSAGRLSRVSLASRLLDSLFDLSLVIRGTVPGGTAAKADYLFREIRQNDPRDVYYGRVIRDGGYLILHYQFFYVMNDWRSGFYGINDHEADWEQIFVFLSMEEGSEEGSGPAPQWVAYASHDFQGDDLRRRWDDPELEKIGTHPVVYAGAGSHASYYAKGEYLMSVAPAFLKPIGQAIEIGQRLWVERLGQGRQQVTEQAEQMQALLRVPFIDYARGDGVAIGPQQERQWTPLLLTATDGWAEQYRGLWGLDPQDFVGGERAPAGPKFNRDGSVRQSWSDPLGWAGLDKVSPPQAAIAGTEKHLETIRGRQSASIERYEQLRERVRILALETTALAETGYQTPLIDAKRAELRAEQAALQKLKAERAELAETEAALERYLYRLKMGDQGDSRAHIMHTHVPERPLSRRRRLVDVWAALSSGLLIIALIVLVSIPSLRAYWYVWLVGVGACFVLIEAIIQGRAVKLLLNITIFLAILSALILLRRFWMIMVIVALGFFVLVMLRENLRELRRL